MTLVSATLAGFAYWFAVARLGGRSEPWDVAWFWTIGYPIGLVVAGLLGVFCRRYAWAAGALFVLAQGIVVAFSGPSPFWAVGIVFLLLLAAPGALVAHLGSRLRRR